MCFCRLGVGEGGGPGVRTPFLSKYTVIKIMAVAKFSFLTRTPPLSKIAGSAPVVLSINAFWHKCLHLQLLILSASFGV